MRDDFLRQQQAHLEAEAERLSTKGIAVTTEVVWTDAPVEEILLQMKNAGADLLIKDTRHEPI